MASKTVIRPIGFIFPLSKRSRYISDVTFIVSNSYQPTNQRAGSLTVTVKKISVVLVLLSSLPASRASFCFFQNRASKRKALLAGCKVACMGQAQVS